MWPNRCLFFLFQLLLLLLFFSFYYFIFMPLPHPFLCIAGFFGVTFEMTTTRTDLRRLITGTSYQEMARYSSHQCVHLYDVDTTPAEANGNGIPTSVQRQRESICGRTSHWRKKKKKEVADQGLAVRSPNP